MKPGTDSYPVRKIALIVALGATLFWLGLLLVWSPTFAGIDGPFFKEAGINFSLGRGLVARADPHYMSWEPLPYRSYPPLFPLSYGLYASLVGVSARSNMLFDAIINAAAALLFLLVVLPRRCNREQLWPNLLLMLAVVVTLPAGPFWQQRERPDVLGYMLIVATLLLLQQHITSRRGGRSTIGFQPAHFPICLSAPPATHSPATGSRCCRWQASPHIHCFHAPCTSGGGRLCDPTSALLTPERGTLRRNCISPTPRTCHWPIAGRW